MSSFWKFFLDRRAEIARLSLEHAGMVAAAMLLGVLVGVPLGAFVSRRRGLAPIILGAATALQTIPSLALLALLMVLVGGIGKTPAILALFIYSLLAIVENTYAGITSVHQPTVEAGRGMGMTDLQVLWMIELPQSLPVLVAGIRVSAVVSIATATIATLIGAGGLGDLIYRGIEGTNTAMVAWGALPAIGMSLLVHWGLTALERRLTAGAER